MDALRVLVVDDNTSLLRFLVSAFEANGCAVTPASAAEQAVELLGGRPYDLVVSDIKMPGLTGLDLLRAVKLKQPGTPVVLITGAPSVNSAVFGLRHGAYDYLPKPFSIKEIQELLARLRADRERWKGDIPLPAGLNAELARRQSSVEALFKIGDFALQAIEPSAFAERALQLVAQSLDTDAALIMLRDDQGGFSSCRLGDPGIVNLLLANLHRSFEPIVKTAGRQIHQFTQNGHPVDAAAALVPGVGRSMGILCIARSLDKGCFLPDEHEMLIGFAQTTSVALQKLVLRGSLEQNLVDTITAFVNAIESKDPYLKGHSARVSLYSGEIATALTMEAELIDVVRRGAMLHDLGKLSIMDTILRKPDRLTEEEFTLIKAHPVIGDRILQPLKFLTREACAVRHHHERFDGTGYPDGLRGQDIPLVARVVAVADVFDAITSTRPYRTALPLDLARDEIERGQGSHFDPDVAKAFLSIPLARLAEINRHYEALLAPRMTRGESGSLVAAS